MNSVYGMGLITAAVYVAPYYLSKAISVLYTKYRFLSMAFIQVVDARSLIIVVDACILFFPL